MKRVDSHKTSESSLSSTRLVIIHLLCLAMTSFTAAQAQVVGSNVSSRNEFLNTMRSPVDIEITMHRADSTVIANSHPGVGIDDELLISGDINKLSELPELRGIIYRNIELRGLIADGVTPLIFKIRAISPLSFDVHYELGFQRRFASGFDSIEVNLEGKLQVLRDGVFQDGFIVTLGPDRQEGFALLRPIKNEEIANNRAHGDAVLKISAAFYRITALRRPATSRNWDAGLDFFIRKPRVVLVHGYDSDRSKWGSDLINAIVDDRGYEFVLAVDYGQESEQNKYSNYATLIDLLSKSLEEKMARDASWAWTRYDAVGHSQGGILLRFLSSSEGPYFLGEDIWQFRSEKNHYRGRFRRMITVGAPHFGSTLNHLGIALRHRNPPIAWGDNLGILNDVLAKKKLEDKMHDKFRITESPPPAPYTVLAEPSVRDLHKLFKSDPNSRMHLLGTRIFDGNVWNEDNDSMPGIYRLSHLDRDSEWASAIAPLGSDGVVDLRSQLAVDSSWNGAAARSIIESPNIAHAAPLGARNDLWDTTEEQMSSADIGRRLVALLNSTNPSHFAPFPNYEDSSAILAEMDQTAIAIDAIVQHLSTYEYRRSPLYPFNVEFKPVLVAAASLQVAGGFEATDESSDPPIDIDINFVALPDEPLDGVVGWSAVLYGPDGVSTQGLTMVTSGDFNESLLIQIDEGVVGELVLEVQYPSATGRIMYTLPMVIWSRYPGELVGIVAEPAALSLPPGPSITFDWLGVFSSGTNMLLFTDTNNMSYVSANTNIASVTDAGEVTLLAPGYTTVFAEYNNTHTGSVNIHVTAPAPMVTSTNRAAAEVGIAFAYQIVASNAPTLFLAEDLPQGFQLDAQSGLITGTPTSEGRFLFRVGAANADGIEGWRVVTLEVTGVNQPPTAVGLSSRSVPALSPAGTIVGTFGTEDLNPLDTHTYALVGGDGATDNNRFTIDGAQLILNESIDPAVIPTCHIRVRSTDNRGLSVEMPLGLPVLGAPVITTQPRDRTVFSGRDFALEVAAEGHGAISYQWYENDEAIDGETLRILRRNASGEPGEIYYHAIITNAHGSVTSSVATVTIEPATFGAWATEHAVPGEPAILPSGDLHNEGIANWFYYAFGATPSNIFSLLPKLVQTNEWLQFVYHRGVNIEPLDYRIMARESLVDGQWEPYPVTGDMTSVTPVDTTHEKVEVNVPVTNQYFFKLEVSE